MRPRVKNKSQRDKLRDRVADLLRAENKPLHNSEIARIVLPEFGLDGSWSLKDLNTCLHDDYDQRFVRVEKGTWTLHESLSKEVIN